MPGAVSPEPTAPTVGELITAVLGRDPDPESPPAWPPDMFAVVATVLKRTGAYLCGSAGGSGDFEHVTKDWRTGLAASPDVVPAEVADRWSHLIADGADIAVDELLTDAQPTSGNRYGRVVCNLRWLLAAADEACSGAGLPFRQSSHSDPESRHFHLRCADDLFWRWWRTKDGPFSSLCEEVHPARAVVLPKLHVSPAGMTLNSLSHNLALCDIGTDVAPIWRWIPSTYHLKEERTAVNVLVIPHPPQVNPRSFTGVRDAVVNPESAGYFAYTAPDLTSEERERIVAAAQAIEDRHGRLDAVVLPEMACGSAAFDELCSDLGQWAAENIPAHDCTQREHHLDRGGLVVIGGVADRDEASSGPYTSSNRVAVSFQVAGVRVAPDNQQSKHHRWRLDSGQIRQYGLGSQLDPRREWWEDIWITQRSLYFWSITEWLGMSVMLCEDLARQEPVAELVRAVGPDLVIALLADGPQLRERWSARYATVLADDPGCSVLSVTSLGMSRLSRPAGRPESRVVGLWKDAAEGAMEIDLPTGAFAVMLSLTREDAYETTADGRTKNGRTRLKLSGIHHVTDAEVDAIARQRGKKRSRQGTAPMLQPYQAAALMIVLNSMIQARDRTRHVNGSANSCPPELMEFQNFMQKVISKDGNPPDKADDSPWRAVSPQDFRSFVAALYNNKNNHTTPLWATDAVSELTELINRSKASLKND